MTPIDPKKVGKHEFQSELEMLDDATAARVLNEYEKAPCRENPSGAARRAGFEAIRDKELQRSTGKPQVLTMVPAPAPIKCLDLETLLRNGVPDINWHLEGWLAERDVALLAGGAGIGKSTLAYDMAVALSEGRPWLGIEPERAYRVGLIDEEQGEGDTVRLLARLLKDGKANKNLFVASGEECRIDSEEGAARIDAWVALHKIETLIMDSAQQLCGVVERNDPGEVGAVYSRLFRLRDRHGIASLLLSHKRKDGAGQPAGSNRLEMVLGSVVFGTQSSSVIYAEPGGPDSLNVIQVKRRGSKKQSIVAVYSEDKDGNITLSSGGEVEDTSTKVSGCSEWLLRHIEETGGPVEKKTLLDHASRLEQPFDSRTVERALTHALSLNLIDRPNRGSYQLKR